MHYTFFLVALILAFAYMAFVFLYMPSTHASWMLLGQSNKHMFSRSSKWSGNSTDVTIQEKQKYDILLETYHELAMETERLEHHIQEAHAQHQKLEANTAMTREKSETTSHLRAPKSIPPRPVELIKKVVQNPPPPPRVVSHHTPPPVIETKPSTVVEIKQTTGTDTDISDTMTFDSATGLPSSGQENRAMLVVCGTDGSGTRRVVQTLTQLGVLMTSEDPETYDIHGDLMGGWPPVVKPIVKAAGTLNYNPMDRTNSKISQPLHDRSMTQLRRLVDKAEQDSQKPESHKLAVGGALKRPFHTDATKVSFGFKAPVAMTLAPYWALMRPKFKLLHVVRDGRDIAFSANQGPVQKFFNDMYGPNVRKISANPKIRAIKLWSDWNTQIYQWAQTYTKSIREQSASGSAFSYLGFHAEDIASSDVLIRYRAISELASFVGSTVTPSKMCCMAHASAQFMGSHDRMDRKAVQARNQGNEQKELSKRYGKWRAAVGNNKQLERELNDAGKDGLALFGYEPSSHFKSDAFKQTAVTINGYECPRALSIEAQDKCREVT